MDNQRVVEDIVTKFFLNTCLLRPQFSRVAVQAATLCAQVRCTQPGDNAYAEWIPVITGSAAEFYIEPMMPHIGDIDVMFHASSTLAIPRGHPPPTQLPAEFHNYVKVYVVVDSHFPGYVYLKLRYLLTECVDDGKYNAVEYDEHGYLLNGLSGTSDVVHGPARLTANTHPFFAVDNVRCLRCLSWPSQVAD